MICRFVDADRLCGASRGGFRYGRFDVAYRGVAARFEVQGNGESFMRARRRIIIISAVVIVHVRNIYPVCDYFKPYFIVERVYVQVVGVIQTECDHAVIVMTFQECVAVFHVDPCPAFVGSVVRPVNIRDKDLVVRISVSVVCITTSCPYASIYFILLYGREISLP